MSGNWQIDGHKLHYHVDRVNDWLQGNVVYPIYLEVSPSGPCNHRCTFCAFDYMEYKQRYIDTDVMKRTLTELAGLGTKSVMYAGEGEPFMHKQMAEILIHNKEMGIDAAVASNGVLFSAKIQDKCLGTLTWIRVSLNGGSKEVYSKVHRTNLLAFDTVLKHLDYAVNLKNKNKFDTTIGVQHVLLDENKEHLVSLARTLKNIGVDYLTVKPYVQHTYSINKNLVSSYNVAELDQMEAELSAMETDSFKINFRSKSFFNVNNQYRGYKKCLGLPFFAEIISNGEIYTCGPYLENKDHCYGNIYNNTFKEIWDGQQRKQVMKHIDNKLDVNKCMINCRPDKFNQYLWDIKNPVPHVNFI